MSDPGQEPRFEPLDIGESELRERMLNGLLSSEMIPRASVWLAQRAAEARSRNEAFQASQAETASRALATAERALEVAERAARVAETENKKDTTARIVAVASIIISVALSVVTALVSHWDATHPTSPGAASKP